MENKLGSFEKEVDNIIDLALAEDTGRGDITSDTLIPPDLRGEASLQVKGRGVVAGGEVARRVFLRVREYSPEQLPPVNDYGAVAAWIHRIWEKKDMEIGAIRQTLAGEQ